MTQGTTVRQAYAAAAGQLADAGVASPEAEAWLLLEAATGNNRAELILRNEPLDPPERRRLGEWLARRKLREPLQAILGRTWFYGLEIAVEPGVLIPRPETERLVEIALQELRTVEEPAILDVGTGSGAVALALAHERPDAAVMATDVDLHALAVTERNVSRTGTPVETVRSDLLEEPVVAAFASRADAIVSNPPYLPATDRNAAEPEVRWDPAGALYAGDDGLEIFRRLVVQAQRLLRPGARLIVELDPRNVHRARDEAEGWSETVVHEDLAGRSRFLLLRR